MSQRILSDFWDVSTPGLGQTFAYGWLPGRHGDSAGGTVNRSTLYAVEPIYTSQRTMTALTCVLRTQLANSIQVHFGLYEADANGLPSTLIYDSGAVDMAQLTTTAISMSEAMKPRTVYWPTVLCNSNWAALIFETTMLEALGVGSDRVSACVVVASHAYGALPASFPTTGTSASATGPDIGMRLT